MLLDYKLFSPEMTVLANCEHQVEYYSGPSFLENVSRIVPIVCRTASLTSSRQSAYRVTRIPLSLRLGFATTLHKIEGQTCTKVALNPTRLRNSAFAYVALSRLRSCKDIFLTILLSKSQLEKAHRNLQHTICAIRNQESLTH